MAVFSCLQLLGGNAGKFRAWMSCLSCSFPFVVSSTEQVASGGDDSHGQVEIFSLNRPTPRSVKSFSLGSSVLCLEYITEPSMDEEQEVQATEVSSKIGNTICVGLQDGK